LECDFSILGRMSASWNRSIIWFFAVSPDKPHVFRFSKHVQNGHIWFKSQNMTGVTRSGGGACLFVCREVHIAIKMPAWGLRESRTYRHWYTMKNTVQYASLLLWCMKPMLGNRYGPRIRELRQKSMCSNELFGKRSSNFYRAVPSRLGFRSAYDSDGEQKRSAFRTPMGRVPLGGNYGEFWNFSPLTSIQVQFIASFPKKLLNPYWGILTVESFNIARHECSDCRA